MNSKKKPLKEVLRTRCLPELKTRGVYFDIGTLRAWFRACRIEFRGPTLNRYMADLVKAKLVWSAGRCWYSFIPTPKSRGRNLTLDID